MTEQKFSFGNSQFKIGVNGRSAQIAATLATQFGVDPNMIGLATPELANQLRTTANNMRQQVEISKAVVESIKMIAECQAQIEALRKEAIEATMKRREEIEKLSSQLEIAIEKHEQVLKKITQDTTHGVRLAQRKGGLDLKSGNNRFKLELQAMRKVSIAKMRVDREIAKQKVAADVDRIKQQPEEAKAKSEERRNFTQFINGKTNQYTPKAAATSAFFN
ncbi:MAG: hypothetical protein KME10_23505 [Plectolyngbya sp. WJT66-NPBG17]|jgi:vacuolar-type H+-ATPase subunit I/STV1|nr:hypothetical protein [Plectolyngbya sp. WJT66-NPBG17]